MSKQPDLSLEIVSKLRKFIPIIKEESGLKSGFEKTKDFFKEQLNHDFSLEKLPPALKRNIVQAQDNLAIKIVFFGPELEYWKSLNPEEEEKENYNKSHINFELANFLIQNDAKLDSEQITKTFPYILDYVSYQHNPDSVEVLKYFIENLPNVEDAVQNFYNTIFIDTDFRDTEQVFGLFKYCVENSPRSPLQDEFNQNDDDTNSYIKNFLFHKVFRDLHKHEPYAQREGIYAEDLMMNFLQEAYNKEGIVVNSNFLDFASKLYNSSDEASAFYKEFFEYIKKEEDTYLTEEDKDNITQFQQFVAPLEMQPSSTAASPGAEPFPPHAKRGRWA